MALSPLNTSGSLIFGLLAFPSVAGWAGPGLSASGVEPLGCPWRLMEFVPVWAGDAVSSDPAGDSCSSVSGLGALAGSCVWSCASPKSNTLISLSVRLISASLSRGAAVLFDLLGAAWVTQPNVPIPTTSGNTCSRQRYSLNLCCFETLGFLYPIVYSKRISYARLFPFISFLNQL